MSDRDHEQARRRTVHVDFVGGPWDGHRQELADGDLQCPRAQMGAWILLDGGWPDDVPTDAYHVSTRTRGRCEAGRR
ncbi:hypothetical protein ACFVH6_23595 [Spirillospora sp. NPDC127200]